jgi:gamma-glutamyl hercynylcysteine S-oxide synthase
MTSQPQRISITPCSSYLEALHDARRHTLALVADLNDEQLMGPRLEIVNPLLWEIGHVAWFQEYWVLRHLNGRAPILGNGDALYDSAKVAHDTRWDLSLLSRADTLAYMQEVLARITDQYQDEQFDGQAEYFLSLAVFHEDMHNEAFGYTRQTLGYRKPQFDGSETDAAHCDVASEQPLEDAQISGGQFLLGSVPDQPFIFDNEMDAHEVDLEPFAIARTAVTNCEFAAFVDDRGYVRQEFWSRDGWSWRQSMNAIHPVYWQREGKQWLRREFDRLVPLDPFLPVLHVNWFEANAFCRWAKRRLPTEAEWEMAASSEPNGNRSNKPKRRFSWGSEPATSTRANLDWRAGGCIDVRALPESDNAFGCRQMIGNVWEWTASNFDPYPGFRAGPYKEYSGPWFGDHKVLRGGCWATRSRMIHNAYRNFYKPERRDVWAGFRTCALK